MASLLVALWIVLSHLDVECVLAHRAVGVGVAVDRSASEVVVLGHRGPENVSIAANNLHVDRQRMGFKFFYVLRKSDVIRGAVHGIGHTRINTNFTSLDIRRVNATKADFLPDANRQEEINPNIECRGIPGILYAQIDDWTIRVCQALTEFKIERVYGRIGDRLSLPNSTRDLNGLLRRFVSLPSEAQRPYQKEGSQADKGSRDPSGFLHALGSLVHRLRSEVHSLLGFKVIYLTLSGFGFAALAGFGAFIVFDDLDRKRNRQYLGRFMLLACPAAAALCFLLGMQ